LVPVPETQSTNYLDLAATEEAFIQRHSSGYRVLVCEFHVGKPLRMTIELIAQDGHSEKKTKNGNYETFVKT
jgi:hypothetical protein